MVSFISNTNNSIHYLLSVHGGARGVMVIVVGNGHDATSSNPGRDWIKKSYADL